MRDVIALRLLAGVAAGVLLNALADDWPQRRWGAAARGTPQPLRKVLVLLAAGGVALGLQQAGQPLSAHLLHMALLFCLLLAGVIDWEQRLLPDPLLLAAGGIALLLAALRAGSPAAATQCCAAIRCGAARRMRCSCQRTGSGPHWPQLAWACCCSSGP